MPNEAQPASVMVDDRKGSKNSTPKMFKEDVEKEYLTDDDNEDSNYLNPDGTINIFKKLQRLHIYKNVDDKKSSTTEKVEIIEQKVQADTTSFSKVVENDILKHARPNTACMHNFVARENPKVLPFVQSSGIKPLRTTYSNANVTSTCNTVTTVTGSITSVLKPGAEKTDSIDRSNSVLIDALKLSAFNGKKEIRQSCVRQHRPGPLTPHYDQALRLCNHDVQRMLGKQFLFEQIYAQGRFFKRLLETVVEGSESKFMELFEIIYHHARSEKRNKKFNNAQLKRITMLQLLGVFISDSTNANLFMLLASARKPHDDEDTVIPCHKLHETHGYCNILKFIGTVLRPSEIKALMTVKNNYSGRSALNIAAVAGSMCQMEALLKLGASTETTDDVGNNPIHYVVRRTNLEYFLLLSHYGADLYACGIGPDNGVDTFAEYVVRACEHELLRNFILNRLSALQTLFLSKSRQILLDFNRVVVEVLSGLHFARAFTPKLRTNKIELDFEFKSQVKAPLDRLRDEIVIVIVPFFYKEADFHAPALEPMIEFENLQTKSGECDLINGHLKFFDLNVFKTTFTFDDSVTPQSGQYLVNGSYVFKLTPKMYQLPLKSGCTVRGRLIFNTSGDSVRFEKTLFAIQAFAVRRGPPRRVEKNTDGQWPDGHRLRDTLLIANEYVKLDSKSLPSSIKRVTKLKCNETTEKKVAKKKAKRNPMIASPMAIYMSKNERKLEKRRLALQSKSEFVETSQ